MAKQDYNRTPDGSQRIIDDHLKVAKTLYIPVFTGSPTLNDNPVEAGAIGFDGTSIVLFNGSDWQPGADLGTVSSILDTKADKSGQIATIKILYSDANWSSDHLTYTFSTPLNGTYLVMQNGINRILEPENSEITQTNLHFVLANAAQPGSIFYVIGTFGTLSNYLSVALPKNYILGEGTSSPTQMIVPPASNNCNVTLISNTDSPNSVVLKFKRRVTKNVTSGTSIFWDNQLFQFPILPSKVSHGFWVKDADINTSHAGNKNYEVWYYDTPSGILSSAIFDILTVIAAVGNIQTGTVSNARATSNWQAQCLDKANGWSFISIYMYNIVYAGSFVPASTFRIYHILNESFTNTWTTIDFAGFVLLFNDQVLYSSVYPDGANVLQYPPSLQSNFFATQNIISNMAHAADKFTIVLNGIDTMFRTSFNATYDIVVTFRVNPTTNSSFNTYLATLIQKTDPITALGLMLNGGTDDDSAPNKISNSYIGGNHGNSGMLVVVATSHGKTVADVGSEWVDGSGRNYFLLAVIDANTLWMISENISGNSYEWVYDVTISGNLTFVAGAVHTGTITVASAAQGQLTPSTKNLTLKVYVDGQLISGDGTYTGNSVEIAETYDIVDTDAAVAFLVSNRPVGGYTTQPALNQGAAVVGMRNLYSIQEQGKILIYWKWICKKDMKLVYFGGTQSAKIQPTWATTYKRYFPASLPISDGTTTFDFRTKVTMLPFPTNTWLTDMNFTSAYWEDAKPVSRVIDMISDGASMNINYNLGVVPIGVGTIAERINNVNNAWFLSTNSKLYPHVIDDKDNGVSIPFIAAGRVYQGAMFRGWVDKTAERTNLFTMRFAKQYYVLLDWHAAGTDLITLPDYMLGLPITMNRKSANVTFTDTIVTGILDVAIATSSPMYGYLELIIG